MNKSRNTQLTLWCHVWCVTDCQSLNHSITSVQRSSTQPRNTEAGMSNSLPQSLPTTLSKRWKLKESHITTMT
ncbi:hypothetical protein E2C01_050003 [Portunus trituberculatus]|uniref:Uncharacterized protein n=1 Tax=Portunus trituberculatus TaxID=210409 RepID=A0A5B7GHM0_PORTR|nr:hypothetical protein [Portunus trituberculatus]